MGAGDRPLMRGMRLGELGRGMRLGELGYMWTTGSRIVWHDAGGGVGAEAARRPWP